MTPQGSQAAVVMAQEIEDQSLTYVFNEMGPSELYPCSKKDHQIHPRKSTPRCQLFGGPNMSPFSHEWSIAAHMKDLTPEEMQKGAEEFFSNMSCQ